MLIEIEKGLLVDYNSILAIHKMPNGAADIICTWDREFHTTTAYEDIIKHLADVLEQVPEVFENKESQLPKEGYKLSTPTGWICSECGTICESADQVTCKCCQADIAAIKLDVSSTMTEDIKSTLMQAATASIPNFNFSSLDGWRIQFDRPFMPPSF